MRYDPAIYSQYCSKIYFILQVAPKVKELMIRQGTLMLGYSPLQYRNIGNFFRMVFTCFPVMEESELDFILDEIERLGDLSSCT